MKQILLLVLLIPTIILAEEVNTSNLISQKFTDSTWSGTNQSSRHGTGTIAGKDGKYVVHDDISLLNDANMNESQIQNGWSSTLGAQIWSWNNYDQVTTMKQTITDNLGNVSTQIRNISTTSSNSYTSYTDKHTQGTNSATDFDISVRFDFDESSNNNGHRATDLRQPTLILTYEQTPITVSETTIEELQAVDTQIESVIQMLDKQEIGGTTFTQMIENIIVDSGLDMELTFAEPDMEMEMYLDETVQIDSFEKAIDDEMSGAIVMDIPTDMEFDEPTMDIPVMEMPVMSDMDMEKPTFTEMAVESFETMTESFSQMFDMEIPADMSTEDAAVIMDAMVEMDMPMEMEKPAMEVTDEVPTMEVTDEMTTMEEPVETVAMNDEPTPEPTMDEPREMEMEEDAPVPTEMNEPTSEPTTEEPVEDEAPVTEEPEPTENETPEPTENDTSTTSEPTPTEDTETVETAEETTVAEVDDDSEVSSTSVSTTVEVETIGKKIEKIIAKVNARLKKVSDRVRAIQVVTLKGMQMDGPQLTSYQQSAFYEPTQMYGGNPDFFQDINILEQQQIYADSRLAYSDNDPIAIQQSILRDINIQKNKILSEIRELRGK